MVVASCRSLVRVSGPPRPAVLAVADARVAVDAADRVAGRRARRRPCSCTRSPWQRRQLSWRIARVPRLDQDRLVEVLERERLRVAVAVLGLGEVLARRSRAAGGSRRRSATVWWLAFCQASYCGCMMWQFTHAFGSALKYESPSAYRRREAADAEQQAAQDRAARRCSSRPVSCPHGAVPGSCRCERSAARRCHRRRCSAESKL